MDIKLLSQKYEVKLIEDDDVDKVFEVCKSNQLYYKYCPPQVTVESIKSDMKALPNNKSYSDKYYIGFFKDSVLIATMDLILDYPDVDTAFIGFFMVNKKVQDNGIGSSIIEEVSAFLKLNNFLHIRLGYVKGNSQSECFWEKNNFKKIGLEVPTKDYIIVVMQKELHN